MSSTTRQPYTPSLVPTPPDLLAKVDSSNAHSALITHVERLGGAQTLQFTDQNDHVKAVAILPKGKKLHSLKPFMDEYRGAPDRITGTTWLDDELSFVRHVNEQKRKTTRLFCAATTAKPTMTAVYNYHGIAEDGTERPAFRDHRAVWPLRLSREWQAWTEASGKLMSALDFAEFLEQRVPDVYWGDEQSDWIKTMVSTLDLRLASSGSLVALSRNLAVNVNVAVRQAQTLSSGEIAMTYVEQHSDGEGQPLRVANAFLIRIPVVLGGPSFLLLARLRYRIAGGGKVSWAFDLTRTELVLEEAIRDICARVELETGLPVFQGTPEA